MTLTNKKFQTLAHNTYIAGLLLTTLVLSACGEWVLPPYNEEEPEEAKKLKPKSAYFDFESTEGVELYIDYGTLGSRALVAVYTEQQLHASDDGTLTMDGDALFQTFLDESGRFVESHTAVLRQIHLSTYFAMGHTGTHTGRHHRWARRRQGPDGHP